MKVINQTKRKVYVNGDIVLRELDLNPNLKKYALSITSDFGNGIIRITNGSISSINSYDKRLVITESKDDLGKKIIVLSCGN